MLGDRNYGYQTTAQQQRRSALLHAVPLTVAVAYLVSRAETLSASNPLVWAAVAVLVRLLSSEWFLRRRRRGTRKGHHPGSEPGAGQAHFSRQR